MKILAIADTHIPFCRPGYLQFCKDLYKKYKCELAVHIGDLVDWHSISFHPKSPDMPSSKNEYELAYCEVQKWHRAFPKLRLCRGNHDNRILRLAESVNIPGVLVKDFNSVWNTSGWIWDWEFVFDDIVFVHGTGTGGINPAYNKMLKTAMSVVMGHHHSAAGIKFLTNPRKRFFGMDLGSGINEKSIAFAYGQFNTVRSVISAGVVLDGHPYLHLMSMARGEKYYDGNFK